MCGAPFSVVNQSRKMQHVGWQRILLGLVVPSATIIVVLLAGPTTEEVASSSSAARPPLPNLAVRSVQLAVTFTPAVFAAPALLLGRFGRENVFEPTVAASFRRSGAAFIKLAQWAGTRPDLLPRTLCEELSSLHSAAPVHPWQFTRDEVELSTGAPIERIFASFDQAPVASGSIGQVHRATLRDGHTQVAVKVRHPGVVLQMQTDFWLMDRMAALVERLPGLEWLDVRSLVGQFGTSLSSQVHLDVEAANLRRAARHFARWRDVGIPTVYFASEAVLVESFVAGRTVGSYVKAGGGDGIGGNGRGGDGKGGKGGHLHSAQRNDDHAGAEANDEGLGPEARSYIVRRGVDIYLKMLLVDNLMHADLHPGNIIFDTGARRGGSKPRLSLVDFGLIAALTPQEQRGYIGFLRALSDGDGEAAAACVLRWSRAQACSSAECQRQFTADLAASYAVVCRGFGTGTQLGDVLRATLELVRTYGVSVEANYMTLVINALCLEGLARELEPSYNVLDAARPLLATSGALGAPSPVFRAALPLLQLAKRAIDARVAAANSLRRRPPTRSGLTYAAAPVAPR